MPERDIDDFIQLLSKDASYVLLKANNDDPVMVRFVLMRLNEAVAAWEKRGVILDPTQFEAVLDTLVQNFIVSYSAVKSVVAQARMLQS